MFNVRAPAALLARFHVACLAASAQRLEHLSQRACASSRALPRVACQRLNRGLLVQLDPSHLRLSLQTLLARTSPRKSPTALPYHHTLHVLPLSAEQAAEAVVAHNSIGVQPASPSQVCRVVDAVTALGFDDSSPAAVTYRGGFARVTLPFVCAQWPWGARAHLCCG